ncbi:MAG: hypothetical protein M3O46_22960 [Myxococcota bacterium]|nr:hypothetical protein [Myxococcota bacterium]
MERSNWHLGAARWTVVAIGTVSFGLYMAWLRAFERVLEPLARRLWGRITGCDIIWVPAGSFRVWGSKQSIHMAREGAIALAGSLFVVASAAVPSLGLHFMALAFEADGGQVRGSAYLMSAPMMLIFVVRTLKRRVEPG